jgi:hypothetical protein
VAMFLKSRKGTDMSAITEACQTYLNNEVMVSIGECKFPCIVTDIKQIYGKILVCITPVNGLGREWLSVDKLFHIVRKKN